MISDNFLLTIAIPVYNRFDYFAECLSSALLQGLDVEIIVVDNCSSHDKFEVECSKYGSQVRYYRNDVNIGMYGNWNRCFELARGKYVMILGDDDILMKGYFDKFKEVCNYTEPDIYFTNFRILDSSKGGLIRNNFTFSVSNNTLFENARYAAFFGIGFPTITMAIRKSVFTNYYDGFTASNDWLWVYTCTEKLKFHGLNEQLVVYRKHHLSDTSNSNDLFKYQIGIAAIYHMISELLISKRSFYFYFALARATKLLGRLKKNESKYNLHRKEYLFTEGSPYRDSLLKLESMLSGTYMELRFAKILTTCFDILVALRGMLYSKLKIKL